MVEPPDKDPCPFDSHLPDWVAIGCLGAAAMTSAVFIYGWMAGGAVRVFNAIAELF